METDACFFSTLDSERFQLLYSVLYCICDKTLFVEFECISVNESIVLTDLNFIDEFMFNSSPSKSLFLEDNT